MIASGIPPTCTVALGNHAIAMNIFSLIVKPLPVTAIIETINLATRPTHTSRIPLPVRGKGRDQRERKMSRVRKLANTVTPRGSSTHQQVQG